MRSGRRYDKAVENSRARKIGRHEAGHYVIARVLGFTTGDITILLGPGQTHKGGAAITLVEPLRNVSDITLYLERRIQVLYAGALAESMDFGEIDEAKSCSILESADSQDGAKAREFVLLLRSIKYPETPVESAQSELNSIGSELWTATIKLVNEHKAMIQGIGNRLADLVDVYGTTFTLTTHELNSIPEVQKRFT